MGEFISQTSIGGLLAALLLALYKRALVFGWEYDKVVKERDALARKSDEVTLMLMESLGVAEKSIAQIRRLL